MSFVVLHVLHLVTAVVWGGGSIFVALILFPSLARLPAAQAQAVLTRIAPLAGVVMGVTGFGVLLTGVLRAWWGGGIASLGDLATPYGVLVSLSFVLTFVITGFEGMFRQRMRRMMDQPEEYARRAPGLARRNAVLTTAGFAAILLMMGLLGTGTY